MKKFLVSLLVCVAVYQAYGVIHRHGSSESTSDPEKASIVVKNGESVALAAGDLVQLDSTLDDGVTVKLTTEKADVPLCMVEAAIAAAAMGRCQTYGLTTILKADGQTNAIVAGKKISSSARAGRVDGGSGTFVGVGLDANSASGTIDAYLKLR